MPAKKDDKVQENDTRLRLFYLYRLLEQHTDEEHPKTTNQLRDLMEKEHGIAMHRTTVYNDIELLKKAGVYINCYRARANEYYLESRKFELPELKLLIDAVESSRFMTESQSKNLTEKLITLTSDTHAQIFADCVEFYNDWGSGDTVSLSTYYRMCDQLVERIKASEELMATDASRFTNGWGPDPDTLYRDPEKHVLAFDLIYCCSTYGLFQGISFVRPKTRERQLIQERKEKAKQLSDNLKEAQKCYQELEEVTDKVKSIFAAGVTIRHRKYGEGIVKSNDGKRITADFKENGEKQLDTSVSFANGIISADGDYDSEAISSYRHILRSESLIKSKLTYAEKEFAPYSDYLE